jgi:hypothetical protein
LTRGFWPRHSRPLFYRGLFSPLSFYVEALFTSLTDDSLQSMGIDTPPAILIVSALYLVGISNQVL